MPPGCAPKSGTPVGRKATPHVGFKAGDKVQFFDGVANALVDGVVIQVIVNEGVRLVVNKQSAGSIPEETIVDVDDKISDVKKMSTLPYSLPSLRAEALPAGNCHSEKKLTVLATAASDMPQARRSTRISTTNNNEGSISTGSEIIKGASKYRNRKTAPKKQIALGSTKVKAIKRRSALETHKLTMVEQRANRLIQDAFKALSYEEGFHNEECVELPVGQVVADPKAGTKRNVKETSKLITLLQRAFSEEDANQQARYFHHQLVIVNKNISSAALRLIKGNSRFAQRLRFSLLDAEDVILPATGIRIPQKELDYEHYVYLFLIHDDVRFGLMSNDYTCGVKGEYSKMTPQKKLDRRLAQLKKSSKLMFNMIIKYEPELKFVQWEKRTLINDDSYCALNGCMHRRLYTRGNLTFTRRFHLHRNFLNHHAANRQGILTAKDIRAQWEVEVPGENDIPSDVDVDDSDDNDDSAGDGEEEDDVSVVTEDAAIQEPPVEDNKLIEYQEPTAHFPSAKAANSVSHFFRRRFFDRERQTGEAIPHVEVAPMPIRDDCSSYVMGIDHGVSNEFIEQWVRFLHNQQAYFYRVSESGRSGSYTRFVSKENPKYLEPAVAATAEEKEKPEELHEAVFLLGQTDGGSTLYEIIEANKEEKDLMELVEEMLLPGLKAAFGEEFPFEINMLQWVLTKGKGYSKHNDCSWWNSMSSENDPYRISKGRRLPTQDQSITVTICIENRQDEEICYFVNWYKDGKKIGKQICTTGNYIHIQFPKMNSEGCQHEVSRFDNYLGPNDWRCVMSFRLVVMPSEENLEGFKIRMNEEAKLKKIVRMKGEQWVSAPLNIINGNSILGKHCLSLGVGGKEDQDSDKRYCTREDYVPENDLRRPEYKDSYDQCTRKMYTDMDLVIPDPIICNGLEAADSYCTYSCMKMMNHLGIVVKIKHNKGDQKYWGNYYPLFGFDGGVGRRHYPQPNKFYPQDPVLSNGKIVWPPSGQGKKDVIKHGGHLLFPCNLIYQHKIYKTDFESLILFMLGKSDYMYTIGSGGSPKAAGSEGMMDFRTALDSENRAHGSCASPQSCRASMNETLIEGTMIEKVVAHFISREVFEVAIKIMKERSMDTSGIETVMPQGMDCYSLGYTTIDDLDIGRAWTSKKIRDLYGAHLNKTQRGYSKYRKASHFLFKMKRVAKEFTQNLPHENGNADIVVGSDANETALREYTIYTSEQYPIGVRVRKKDFTAKLIGLGMGELNSDKEHVSPLDPEEIMEHHMAFLKNLKSNPESGDLPFLNKGFEVNQLSEQSIPVDEPTSRVNEEEKQKNKEEEGEDAAPTEAELENKDAEDLNYERPATFQISIEETVNTMVFIGGALGARVCGHCFAEVEKGKKKFKVATPLPNKYKPCGTIARTYSLPSNNRGNDFITSTMLKAHWIHRHGSMQPPEECYIMAGNRRVRNRTSLPNGIDRVFVKEVYQCIVTAITGRPGAIGNYLKQATPKSGQPVPTPEEIDHYINHVQATKNSGTLWSHHVHWQFHESIPQRVRDTFDRFVVFSRALATDFYDKFLKVMELSKVNGRVNRLQVIFNLARLLQECCAQTTDREWWFVSGQVVSTMEELYDGDLLGPVTFYDIIAGFGGVMGSKHIIQLGRPSLRKKVGKKDYYCLHELMTIDVAQELLNTIYDLDDDRLSCLTLYKDDKNVVRSLVNNRPINWVDVEHILCKLYHMIKFKTPGWQRVMQPKFTKTYCRPFRTNNVDLNDDQYTLEMFNQAHLSLLNICYNKTIVIDCMPEEFLYEKEITAFEDIIMDKTVARREKREQKEKMEQRMRLEKGMTVLQSTGGGKRQRTLAKQ